VDYLRGLLLVRMGNAALLDVTRDAREAMARQASQFEISRLLRCIRAFNQAAADQRSGWQMQLPLELAFVECTLPEAAPPEPVVPAVEAQPAPARPAPPARHRAASPPPARAERHSRPAASAPAAEPAAPPAGGDGPITVGLIRSRWKQVKAAAKRQQMGVASLINSCQVMRVEGDLITLRTQAAIVVEKLGEETNRVKVQAAFSEALGRPLRYQCVLASDEDDQSLPPDDIAEDGVLATALRDLGGQLRDD
jgi:DNA polymerase-3 subunit gamma/tau